MAVLLDSPVVVGGESLEQHIVYENDDYEPTLEQAYIEAHWRPNDIESSLDAASHYSKGTMRFACNAPNGIGMTYLNLLTDQVIGKFPLNMQLTRGDWLVQILALTPSAASRVGAWRRTYVDVTYQATRS